MKSQSEVINLAYIKYIGENMTNKEILDIAMRQSAYDINAKVSDFLMNTNVFVKSEIGLSARKYYKEPIACNLVSYGNNIVASVKDEYREIVETYLNKFEFYHCFDARKRISCLFYGRVFFARC